MMQEFIPREFGEDTTFETRHEAHESVDKNKRYSQILEVLEMEPYTAREIAHILYLTRKIPEFERNFVSPRLTELMNQGIIEPIGKKKDRWTGRMVSVFGIRKDV